MRIVPGFRFVVFAVVASVGLVPALEGSEGEGYQLSTFSADVTPPLGHPLLAGWSKPAESIKERLEARGLVLFGPTPPIVVVGVDWCELRNDSYDRWRDVLADAAGTDRTRVLVSCLHQHDAPYADLEAQRLMDVHGLPGSMIDPEIHEQSVQRVAGALRASLASKRRMTHFGIGEARVESVACNRRVQLEGQPPRFNRFSSTSDPKVKYASDGVIDPMLKTLSFWDGERAVAAISCYAVHPMSYYGKGEVSYDFVGMAREKRQRDDAGVFQIYLSGASGDTVAAKYNDGTPSSREALAERLYRGMKDAWTATERVPITDVQFRNVALRFDPSSPKERAVLALEKGLADPAASYDERSHAALGLSWHKRCATGQPIDLPVIDFGAAQFLVLPAESFVAYQLAAQKMRPDSFVVVAGYGECAPGYIPTEETRQGFLRDNGYCWVAPGAEKTILTALEEVLASASDERPTPRGTDRILFVSDPSSVAIKLLPDPVEEKDLRRWVDTLADSGVDIFNQEIYSQGWTAYWKADGIDYDQRKQHERFLPMIASGTQPVEVLIDQSHKRGMKFIAGFRVNDNHAYAAKRQGVRLANVILEHPEWALKGFPDEPYYAMSEPLDFSFEGPRDFVHAVIETAVSRFNVDGIELCFRDHGYFPHGTGRQRKHLMNQLIRRIRATVNKAGTAKGKKLLVGARVFPFDDCLFLGLDVPTWVSEGWVDYLSPQDMMYGDFNLPYEKFAALTRNSKCMLYPAMMPWPSLRWRVRTDQALLTAANQRALALNMYGAGADGIAAYNHFSTLWHPPFYPQALRFFHVLRDPKRIRASERHYVFDPTWAGSFGFGPDKRSTGVVDARKILLDRGKPNAEGTYEFRMYEDLTNCYATLSFRGFHMTAHDELIVSLNGQVVDPDAIGRTAAKDAPDDQWNVIRKGRKYRAVPEAGRVEFRTATDDEYAIHRPDPTYSTRWFDLKDLPVKRGINRLSVTLTRGDPKVKESIVIDEVDVWVQP